MKRQQIRISTPSDVRCRPWADVMPGTAAALNLLEFCAKNTNN